MFHFNDEADTKKCIKFYYENDGKSKSIFNDSNTIFN